jgi:hypothetical protein
MILSVDLVWLFFLLCWLRGAAAQSDKLVGVEAFDYEYGDFADSKRNGGEGFANNSAWSIEQGADIDCTVARANWNISSDHIPTLVGAKSPFASMIGIDPTPAGGTRKCLFHREMSPNALGFAPSTLWWFSLLVGVNRSSPVWGKPFERREDSVTPAFLFSIGDTEVNVRNNGDATYGGLYSSGVTVGPSSGSLTGSVPRANVTYHLQMVGFNAVTFGTSRIATQLSNEWPSSALLVVSLQWDQATILPRHYFRAALFDASLPPPTSMPSDAAQIYLTGGSPTQRRYMSIWLQNMFAGWLRVGNSFDAVVGNAPVTLKTTTTTSSSTARTTTTTTRTTTTSAAPITLPSGASVASTTADAATTASSSDTTVSHNNCDAQTSCAACFGVGDCTWCVATKRCVTHASVNGGSCSFVAVSIKSCDEPMASDAVLGTATLGAPALDDNLGAIVGGAVGGCVALLLLLLLVVFLVRRSRNRDDSGGDEAGRTATQTRQRATSRAPESEYEFADLAAMREEASHYKALEMAPQE